MAGLWQRDGAGLPGRGARRAVERRGLGLAGFMGAVVVFYLVRDVLLYLFLPFLVLSFIGG